MAADQFAQNEVLTEPGSHARLTSIEVKLDKMLAEIHRRAKAKAQIESWFRFVVVPLIIAVTHLLTRVWVKK